MGGLGGAVSLSSQPHFTSPSPLSSADMHLTMSRPAPYTVPSPLHALQRQTAAAAGYGVAFSGDPCNSAAAASYTPTPYNNSVYQGNSYGSSYSSLYSGSSPAEVSSPFSFLKFFFYQQTCSITCTCRAAMLHSPPGRCAVQGLPRTPRLSLLHPAMALPPLHTVRSWTETATDRVRWSPAASTPQPAPCTLWAAPHSFPTLLKWPPPTPHRITHWPPHRSMGILTHPTACTPPLPLLCILFLTTTLSTHHHSVSPTILHFLPWLFGSKSNQKPSSLTS